MAFALQSLRPKREYSVRALLGGKSSSYAVEAMLWAAAWGAAQTKTLARLEALSAERDGLQATTAAQAADVSALTEQLDMLEVQAQAHAQALATAQATAQDLATAAAAQAAAQAQALTTAKSDIARVTEAAEHAAELAVRDAKIERQTMQMTIERLTDQLSESKALHIAQAMKPLIEQPVAEPKE